MTSSTTAPSVVANMRRAAVAVFAVLFMLGLTVAQAPKSQAWISGACKTSNGVTVIVDFAGLGGGTTTRCAPGSQSTGISALRNAGFTVGFVQQNSSQGLFVCRINNSPGPSAESCATTPPTSASWSYWHANRGGSWRYSSSGAGNRKPAAGSVEGWRFSNGRAAAPSAAVPATLPAASSNRPTSKPTGNPSGSSASKPSSVATKRPTEGPSSGSTAGSQGEAARSSSRATSTGSNKDSAAAIKDSNRKPTPANTATPGGDQPESADAVIAGDAAGPGAQESSPAGTLVVLALLALLGVGAAVVFSRRARAG